MSTEVATTDANWLLSTTAQSAAALVAIIGGFVLQKAISMKAQKTFLKGRRGVLINKRVMTQDQVDRARDVLRLSNAKRFYNQNPVFFAEVRKGKEPNFDNIWDKYVKWDMEDEEIDKNFIEKTLLKIVLMPSIDSGDFKSGGYATGKDSLSSLGVEQFEIELSEFVHRRIMDPKLHWDFHNSEIGRSDRAQKVAKYTDLKFQLSIIDVDIKGIESEFLDKIELRDLTFGFYTLLGLGIAGILTPLILMALISPGSTLTRNIVIASFSLGFTSISLVIGRLVYNIKHLEIDDLDLS